MTAGVTGESIRLSAPAGLEYTSFTDPQGVFNGTGRLDGGTVLSGVVAASAQGHHLVIGCAGATSSVEGVIMPVASARCRLTQSRRFGRAGLASAVPVQMWQRVGLTQWMAQSLLAQGSGAQSGADYSTLCEHCAAHRYARTAAGDLPQMIVFKLNISAGEYSECPNRVLRVPVRVLGVPRVLPCAYPGAPSAPPPRPPPSPRECAGANWTFVPMDGARNADIGAMFRVGAYLSPRPQTCAAR